MKVRAGSGSTSLVTPPELPMHPQPQPRIKQGEKTSATAPLRGEEM